MMKSVVFYLKRPRIRRRIFLGCFLLVAACTPPEGRDYRSGQEEASKGHFTISLSLLERATKRAPGSHWSLLAAREGSRIAYFELKDYRRATEFLKELVLYSPERQERLESQKKIGEIYLENLQDYPKAIIEYNRLVEQNLPEQELGQFRLALARAHYFMNDLFQTESELNRILKLKIDPPLRFNTMMLKGNLLIAKKDFQKASSLFRELIEDQPDKSLQENVPMVLAVCYEEAGDYKSALAVLEGLRGKYNPAEYIELRIKRLKERQKNQPGAKGFRK